MCTRNLLVLLKSIFSERVGIFNSFPPFDAAYKLSSVCFNVWISIAVLTFPIRVIFYRISTQKTQNDVIIRLILTMTKTFKTDLKIKPLIGV